MDASGDRSAYSGRRRGVAGTAEPAGQPERRGDEGDRAACSGRLRDRPCRAARARRAPPAAGRAAAGCDPAAEPPADLRPRELGAGQRPGPENADHAAVPARADPDARTSAFSRADACADAHPGTDAHPGADTDTDPGTGTGPDSGGRPAAGNGSKLVPRRRPRQGASLRALRREEAGSATARAAAADDDYVTADDAAGDPGARAHGPADDHAAAEQRERERQRERQGQRPLEVGTMRACRASSSPAVSAPSGPR